jgi:hypothetical protein
MVDVGVAIKPVKSESAYARRDPEGAFASMLADGPEALGDRYFTTLLSINNRPTSRITENELVDHIDPAFLISKNTAGYAPIIESVAYANTHAWQAQAWRTIETNDMNDSLTKLTHQDPPGARIVSDRFRRPSGYKLLN